MTIELTPGGFALHVHINFTEEAQEAYREEDFGYASFDGLRIALARMIRAGEAKIDKIENGRAHVACDVDLLKKIVDKVVGHRAARRSKAA